MSSAPFLDFTKIDTGWYRGFVQAGRRWSLFTPTYTIEYLPKWVPKGQVHHSNQYKFSWNETAMVNTPSKTTPICAREQWIHVQQSASEIKPSKYAREKISRDNLTHFSNILRRNSKGDKLLIGFLASNTYQTQEEGGNFYLYHLIIENNSDHIGLTKTVRHYSSRPEDTTIPQALCEKL